jgi:hypothetical protein
MNRIDRVKRIFRAKKKSFLIILQILSNSLPFPDSRPVQAGARYRKRPCRIKAAPP